MQIKIWMENKKSHKFYFAIKNSQQWYNVMAECRRLFGKEWSCQGKVRRKLDKIRWSDNPRVDVWFEVPDSKFGVWITLKTGVELIKQEIKKPVNN